MKAYDRVKRDALRQVLRMYGVDGKIFNGIESMYISNQACVRVKGGESECFRFDRGVREGCIMFPWLFSVYKDAVMKRGENWEGEDGSEISRRGNKVVSIVLLNAGDLVLCGESKQDLKVMIESFVEVCSRRDLNTIGASVTVQIFRVCFG